MQIWKFNLGSIFLIFIAVGYTIARPADSPYKLDLPVYTENQGSGALDPDSAPKLEEKSGGASQTPLGFVSRLLSGGVQAASNQVNGFASSLGSLNFPKLGPLSDPPRKLEGAIFEPNVAPIEKAPTIKQNLQNIVAGIIQPKPVVDSIQEYEKYGNTGDKFAGASKVVVGGYEAFSNVVNTVLEAPFRTLKQITRTASEKLNNLGGRLIGL